MSRVSVAVVIEDTPARVWEVVEPIENHVDWMADAVAIRVTSSHNRGIGVTFDCDTKVGPLKLTDKMEIVEWLPGSAMGVRHSGIVTGAGRFTLTPLRGGTATRFAWDEDLRFPWWLGGPITGFIGGGLVMRLIWRRNLKELKQLVERGA
jgi:hypothetical protein